LKQFELRHSLGIHWDHPDKDTSIDELLADHGDRTPGRFVKPA
jgi:hypothetical protein